MRTDIIPSVFLIGKSTPVTREIVRWLNSLKARKAAVLAEVHAGDFSSGETLVSLAGKRCYMSFELGLNPNIQRVRTDMSEFIANILKSGHGSVLEHVTYTFALENVSRVFTGEMNRHRAGMAISEGSMRYIRFDNIPFWIPPSIQENDKDSAELAEKKQRTRDIFEAVFQNVEIWYAQLQEIWKDELSQNSTFHNRKQITSMMRRIIPMGVASGGVWSGNLRALRHIFTMRCSEAAEEEILFVACRMLDVMIDNEPEIFGDFYKDEKGYWKPKYVKV